MRKKLSRLDEARAEFKRTASLTGDARERARQLASSNMLAPVATRDPH
jgi:predicted RNA polymerase sigma factor